MIPGPDIFPILPSRLLIVFLALLHTNISFAHHSFSATYDLSEKVEISGVVKSFDIVNPHIRLVVEVQGESGVVIEWDIESMNPRRWDSVGHSREIVEEGDVVRILGWAAHDGSPKMTLSAVTNKGTETVILDRIRQGGRVND